MKKPKREGVLNMQTVREILRLVAEGHNQSEIAAASGASRAAVQDYLRQAEARSVTYEEAKGLTDEALIERLGKQKPGRHATTVTSEPDFAKLDTELDRKGMTLALLWQEWSQDHPGSHYSYSTFCRRSNRYRRAHRVTLRQQHQPGQKLFIQELEKACRVANERLLTGYRAIARILAVAAIPRPDEQQPQGGRAFDPSHYRPG